MDFFFSFLRSFAAPMSVKNSLKTQAKRVPNNQNLHREEEQPYNGSVEVVGFVVLNQFSFNGIIHKTTSGMSSLIWDFSVFG